MKVLQAVSAFHPALGFGGGSKIPYVISKELVKRGHAVTVLTTNAFNQERRLRTRNDYYLIDGMRVKYLKNIIYMPRRHVLVAPQIIKFFKESAQNFDVIHLHEYRSFFGIALALLQKKQVAPYILQAHGSLPKMVTKQRLKSIYDMFLGHRLLKGASKLIAITQMEAQQYKDAGVPEEKIEVIPNAIDLSEFDNLPPGGSFREKFSFENDERIILYVGRIHRLKGVDFLIKSLAFLINSGMTNVKLALVGPDDGYLNDARNLVDALGISEHVLFTGFVSEEDKISAYVDSTIVVYPRQNEPFGLVPLEAAVVSKPSIVAKGTFMSEVIKDGGFGSSVEYGDVEGLANKLKMFLVDDELAMKMGTRGRQYVVNNYALDRVIDKLEKLYELVTAESVEASFLSSVGRSYRSSKALQWE